MDDSCCVTHLSYSKTIKEKKCQQINAQIVENLASPTCFLFQVFIIRSRVLLLRVAGTIQIKMAGANLVNCHRAIFFSFSANKKRLLIWQLSMEFSFTTENWSLSLLERECKRNYQFN